MSHEVETMAWANEVPWHRLGYQIGDDATPEQILRVADLDWNVNMKPVQWTNANTAVQTSEKYFSQVSVSPSALVHCTGFILTFQSRSATRKICSGVASSPI